jgi:hypothetical protein
MLRSLLRRRIDAFEKAYDYDGSHMCYILDVSPDAALKFDGGGSRMDEIRLVQTVPSPRAI